MCHIKNLWKPLLRVLFTFTWSSSSPLSSSYYDMGIFLREHVLHREPFIFLLRNLNIHYSLAPKNYLYKLCKCSRKKGGQESGEKCKFQRWEIRSLSNLIYEKFPCMSFRRRAFLPLIIILLVTIHHTFLNIKQFVEFHALVKHSFFF